MAGIKISVERIQQGNYVKLPMRWGSHPFLFTNFKIKSQQQIDIIRSLGLKHINIVPEKSDAPPLPPQADQDYPVTTLDNEKLSEFEQQLWQDKQQRIDQLKEYSRNLQQCEKRFENSLAQVRNLMNKIRNRPLNAITEATELVNSMAESLFKGDDTVLHLMGESKDTENLYYHSLNVAVLGMLLGKICGFSEQEVKAIGLGGLFHDMGELKLPSQLLNKTQPLTAAEANFLKLHVKYGLELLEHAKNFPPAAKTIVAQHHELIDGSGYPQGLKGEQIHKLAQLVAVVDQYDEICHPKRGSKAKVPYSALSYLYKTQTKVYNKEFLGQLIRLLGVYPPGSVVELSGGQVGLVMSVSVDSLLYPSVLIYDPDVPRSEAAVIKLQEKELTIKRVLNPTALPEPVRAYLNPRTRISYYFDHKEKKS